MKVGDLVRHRGDGTMGLIIRTNQGGSLVLFTGRRWKSHRELWMDNSDLELFDQWQSS